MALSPADLRKLKDAFNEWANNHPAPDVPAMGFGKILSPREIAREVEAETKDGKDFIHMVDLVISDKAATLDEVITRLASKPPKP